MPLLFGCMFGMFAAFMPRIALLVLWLFTGLVDRAFHNTFIWPLLGIIFLPFTTLMYILVYNPIGISFWGWVWIIIGFVFDIYGYAGTGYSNRDRLGMRRAA
jgi:hypothetical protein